MANSLKAFLIRHRAFIVYMIVGAMATAVNTVGYWLFYEKIGIFRKVSISFDLSNILSTVLSWIITVIFAFFTNKIFVFHSKSWSVNLVIKEGIEFVLCRIFSELFDIAFMYIAVSIFSLPSVLMKFIASLIVGLINYFGGKLFIFKSKLSSS